MIISAIPIFCRHFENIVQEYWYLLRYFVILHDWYRRAILSQYGLILVYIGWYFELCLPLLQQAYNGLAMSLLLYSNSHLHIWSVLFLGFFGAIKFLELQESIHIWPVILKSLSWLCWIEGCCHCSKCWRPCSLCHY